MCKDTTISRNEQGQTDFFVLFEANKKVEVGFSAPEMTNLGGMCVLRRITKDDDFVGVLARKVREWRNPKLTEHSIKEMMDQRVLQIAAGYEDADDCDLLRKDGMMKLMVGRLPSGGEHCYMPLFIFEGFSGKLVVPILRPGRTNKRDNVAGLLIRLITYLRKFWPNTMIVVRGDGMFSSSEFMEWANGQKNLHYVLGFSGNSRLSQRTAAWVAHAEEQHRRTGQDVKVYHRFMYRATRWNRAQWIVVKIEFNAEGKNVRYVVTDMYHKPPRDVYANWYCKRGNCELYIKEMKDGLKAHRMSCGSFLANQFRLFLHAAAYVLVLQVKQKLFAGHETLATATILTLRKRVIWQTARITELKTKIKIEFQRDNPMKQEIMAALTAA